MDQQDSEPVHHDETLDNPNSQEDIKKILEGILENENIVSETQINVKFNNDTKTLLRFYGNYIANYQKELEKLKRIKKLCDETLITYKSLDNYKSHSLKESEKDVLERLCTRHSKLATIINVDDKIRTYKTELEEILKGNKQNKDMEQILVIFKKLTEINYFISEINEKSSNHVLLTQLLLNPENLYKEIYNIAENKIKNVFNSDDDNKTEFICSLWIFLCKNSNSVDPKQKLWDLLSTSVRSLINNDNLNIYSMNQEVTDFLDKIAFKAPFLKECLPEKGDEFYIDIIQFLRLQAVDIIINRLDTFFEINVEMRSPFILSEAISLLNDFKICLDTMLICPEEYGVDLINDKIEEYQMEIITEIPRNLRNVLASAVDIALNLYNNQSFPKTIVSTNLPKNFSFKLEDSIELFTKIFHDPELTNIVLTACIDNYKACITSLISTLSSENYNNMTLFVACINDSLEGIRSVSDLESKYPISSKSYEMKKKWQELQSASFTKLVDILVKTDLPENDIRDNFNDYFYQLKRVVTEDIGVMMLDQLHLKLQRNLIRRVTSIYLIDCCKPYQLARNEYFNKIRDELEMIANWLRMILSSSEIDKYDRCLSVPYELDHVKEENVLVFYYIAITDVFKDYRPEYFSKMVKHQPGGYKISSDTNNRIRATFEELSNKKDDGCFEEAVKIHPIKNQNLFK